MRRSLDQLLRVRLIRTTTVELESSLEGDALLGAVSFGVLSLRGVECIYIGLMMLSVVKSHDLFRDIRLESIIIVWKGG